MGAPTAPRDSRYAVVLAGGESRRFGTDKLAASVEGRPLLDQAIAGLPADLTVLVVGPTRSTSRPVRFLREHPPGGGPAAGMVTGLTAALADGAAQIVVLPGDAPHAGEAARLLLDVLAASPSAHAVVGTDATGFDQPLQLALRPTAAAALVAAAGAGGGQGGSARALVNRLDPPALRSRLPIATSYDIDTPEQLHAWTDRSSTSVAAVLDAVDALAVTGRPAVVAVDGPSGAGSSLAAALVLQREATLVESDDFYSPRLAALTGAERAAMTDQEVADEVIDWRRLRTDALEPLLRGEQARYAPYDWRADDGRLGRLVTRSPAALVVVEGAYSGRPELAELVDLAVVVTDDDALRPPRWRARAHESAWWEFWLRGERHYFTSVRPPSSFDLQCRLSAEPPRPAAG